MTASWVSVAAYMGLIYVVSASSFNTPLFAKAQKIHLDWMVHVVEYAVLGFLLARALKRTRRGLGVARLYAAALAIGVFYAVTDEFHQSFVPTRDPSAHDVLADAMGIALGVWLWTRRPNTKGVMNA
jgi:VanZ family protein